MYEGTKQSVAAPRTLLLTWHMHASSYVALRMRGCEHHAKGVLCAPLATRAAAAAAAAVACAQLMRVAHRSLRAGAPRLSAVMPVVALFCVLPVRAAALHRRLAGRVPEG